MEPLTQGEFLAWKRDPTTRKVFRELEIKKTEAVDDLSRGGTMTERADSTAIRTALVVGAIEGITEILEMEID